MQLHDLIRACCALAPEALAEEWDNVGLQAGEPKQPVASVLLCVDLTPDVLAEAERLGVGCVVSHHPLIFRPLRTVREDRVEGHLLSRLVRAGIALYVMHTNLDLACPGTSDALAGALGVVATEPLQRLDRAVGERQVKLAVFVPLANADGVRTAMGDAGAGIIGDYSHCSFSTPGTGSFRPLEGAHPTIGSVGTQEKVSEERVEVLVPAGALPRVVDAMLATHPYQEVAYDLYPLAPPPSRTGLGRIGRPAQPCTLGEFADLVRRHLPASHVLVCGIPPAPSSRWPSAAAPGPTSSTPRRLPAPTCW